MKLNDALNALEIVYERVALRKTNFIMVSNNCWGYEIYNRLHRAYNTPFVGNFMYPDCYLAMLGDRFPNNLSQITQAVRSKHADHDLPYPVGTLTSGSEVHFLHEQTWQMASEKWQRRSARLQEAFRLGVSPFFKLCDRDSATPEQFRAFHSLGFANSITISASDFAGPRHLKVATSFLEPSSGLLVDGLSLYRRRYEYMDFAAWLGSGNFAPTAISSTISRQARLMSALKKLVRRPTQ
jgi:uncharacterized protein (DUF1919 family)